MTATFDQDILAIDIGGTKIALATVRNGLITQRLQIATPRSGSGSDIVGAIADQVSHLPAAKIAGVATTGIIDAGCLTALNPATLPIEDRFPLADALEARLGLPILAINDAQAAVWAEHRLGAGQGASRMVFVTVSTGIGAGLVLDGKLHIGSHGLAGHIGHMVGDPKGPRCGCGRNGCVELLASGTAIGLIATERLGRKLSAPEVFAMATDGDQACQQILRQAALALANTLCDLVASLDLDVIVIGGGVGLAAGFAELLQQAVDEQPVIFRRQLLRAEMGADAGLVGAALLAGDEKLHP